MKIELNLLLTNIFFLLVSLLGLGDCVLNENSSLQLGLWIVIVMYFLFLLIIQLISEINISVDKEDEFL